MDETKTIELSNRFFWLIAALITGIVVYCLGALAYQFKSLPQNYPQQLSVQGEGKAVVKPDIARVSFGMNTQGIQSQEVVDRNNRVMNGVIAAIKNLGVEEKDIQTTLYSLNPVYDYTERGRIFKGYSLEQQIMVKIRNFDKISSILDVAVSQGANTVGDLQFAVDDPAKSQAEAREKAITQAKEKAMTMARQSGLRIHKLINVQEGYNYPSPVPFYGQGGAVTKDSASIAPSIQTGQMEVSTTVTLTYLLK